MIRVPVALAARSYDVLVGDDVIGEAGRVLAGRRRVAVVTQAAVAAHWSEPVLASLDDAGVAVVVAEMGDGEEAKTLATVEALCSRFVAGGLLRGDAVVALGGGVVGDTAGFAAAVYHRGVDVVQVPTTLLAQVDAAIGGKTALNLPEGKNLVGAFHQPLAVLADTRTLATLPDREFRCGLGEVAKYALMHGAATDPTGLVEVLRHGVGSLLARAPDVSADVVARCAGVKAEVVAADEEERTGLRATLNYGHTLAHALETVSDHEVFHGEAVAIGLVFAAELAHALDRVDPDEVDRHRALVASLGLPTSAPPGLHRDELLTVMQRDKKSRGGVTFVLRGPGGLDRVDDPPGPALAHAFGAVGIGE